MPTGDGRRRFVPMALRCWLRQTHPDRELVVVDDGTDEVVEALCRGLDGVTVLRVDPAPLGTKLNAAIAAARGDMVQKWDDDDWYAPRFLATGVAAVEGMAVGAGFSLWENYLLLLAWTGRLHVTGPGHKAGMSLLFDRSLWEEAPFRELPHSVDSWFINDHGPYTPVDDPAALVAVRHRSNTWTRFWDTEVDPYIEGELPPWPESLAEVVGEEDAAFYDELRRSLDVSGTQP